MAGRSPLGNILLVALLVFGFNNLTFFRTALLIGALAVFFVFSIYRNQEALLYQPRVLNFAKPSENPDLCKSPQEHDIPFESIYLDTPDGERLHSWLLLQKDPSAAPTIVFFHENAGNMGLRLPNLKVLYERIGVNIFILSYRGYGESTGAPGEEGLVIDAQTALNYVFSRKDIDTSRVIVFGRSLGGAVGIAISSDAQFCQRIRGLIVENSFTSISDLVDSLFPFLSYLKSCILRLKWPSKQRIAAVHAPVLFLSGELDEVVPAVHMHRLCDAAISCKSRTFVSFPQGMHNDTWLKGGQLYLAAIRHFVRLAAPPGAPKIALVTAEEDGDGGGKRSADDDKDRQAQEQGEGTAEGEGEGLRKRRSGGEDKAAADEEDEAKQKQQQKQQQQKDDSSKEVGAGGGGGGAEMPPLIIPQLQSISSAEERTGDLRAVTMATLMLAQIQQNFQLMQQQQQQQ